MDAQKKSPWTGIPICFWYCQMWSSLIFPISTRVIFPLFAQDTLLVLARTSILTWALWMISGGRGVIHPIWSRMNSFVKILPAFQEPRRENCLFFWRGMMASGQQKHLVVVTSGLSTSPCPQVQPHHPHGMAVIGSFADPFHCAHAGFRCLLR